MVESFDDIDIYCLWNDDPMRYGSRQIYETVLARTPLRHRKVLALPAALVTWRHLPAIQKYDWALVSSHSFAHHARFSKNPDLKKLVYVHTPARYIWAPEADARGRSLAARTAGPMLRTLDRQRAKEIYSAAANSKFVAQRIERSWGIDASTIYPPVDVSRIQAKSDWSASLTGPDADLLGSLPSDFILGASRFVEYKKLETVIDIAVSMGVAAVIAGSGPDEMRLRAHAKERGALAIFILKPSDSLLYALYQQALLYVFPALEDFGIMPVEAMAAGALVLANEVGGTSETVEDGRTGALANFCSKASITEAVQRALSGQASLSRSRAMKFSDAVFRSSLSSWVASKTGI
ncbi:glycosyltransferase [Arthrobacter sp. B0490]|uniref:glycosyltransferase n=1 Tax=Arthrobacter sp. B0490 TaxID=2058891 RepID=UPI002157803B|nr:glycosyltransferase [Arthrobacter sp. B0490]